MRRKRMAAAIISLAIVLSFVTSAFAVVDTYNNWRGFGIFEQGDSGGKVRAIQNITKYYLGKGTSYTADGAYGSRTTAAVKEYQQKKNRSADGIVGPETWNCLRNELVDDGGGMDVYFTIKIHGGATTNTKFFNAWSTTSEPLPNPPWHWRTYKAEPGSAPGQWYLFDG